MSSPLRFDPIFPAHAIERCSATVVFDQAVPQKIFSSFRETHRARLLGAGLVDGPQTVGMKFDLLTGNVVPIGGDGPISYVTPDRGTTVTIVPNQVNLTNIQYTRWAHFEAALTKLLIPLVTDYSQSVSISAVQLDYLDRFIWSGTWDNFDSTKLLIPAGDFVAARPARAAQQWHSHSGWFEVPAPGKRRLVNVNIDTASATLNAVLNRPSIGILTLIQDGVIVVPPHTSPDWIDEAGVIPILRQQHLELKDLLRQIIIPEMAKQIGL